MLFRYQLDNDPIRPVSIQTPLSWPAMLTRPPTIRLPASLRLTVREWVLLAIIAYLSVQWWRDRAFLMPVMRWENARVVDAERLILERDVLQEAVD